MLDWNEESIADTTSVSHEASSVTTGDDASEQSQGEAVTGLEQVELGANRVTVDEKRIINCRADVNQLMPLKYEWAWDKYLSGCANHWMPQEVNMGPDIAMWQDPDALTDDERLILNAGKMVLLDKLLLKLHNAGHRVLIFSQVTVVGWLP